MAESLDGESIALRSMLVSLRKAIFRPWLLWAAPLSFLGLFYFYPLLTILQVSFTRSQTQFLEPFVEIFTSPALRNVIAFTFWQAILSTLLTLLFGLPGAYLLARYQVPGKSLILAMTAAIRSSVVGSPGALTKTDTSTPACRLRVDISSG